MRAIIIEGDAKEITALVLATQEQRKVGFVPCDARTSHIENPCTAVSTTN